MLGFICIFNLLTNYLLLINIYIYKYIKQVESKVMSNILFTTLIYFIIIIIGNIKYKYTI